MLAATKRVLVIIMAGMVILCIIGMVVVILGTTGIIDMVGNIGMCRVVIGMVVNATIIVMAIVMAIVMVIKLGIVGIVTDTVGMNTVGLLVASNNLTFYVIITAWSG